MFNGRDLLLESSDYLVAIKGLRRAEGINTLCYHFLFLEMDTIFNELADLGQEEFRKDVTSLIWILL